MEYKVILDKMEDIFINLGFSPVTINGIEFMRYKECYCRLTFLKEWSAFVIESADNVQDAEKGILEDGDLYYTDIPETQLLSQLKSDLEKYYLSD